MMTVPAKPAVLAIAGPTGAGKSALALALAEQLQGDILCADSMQVYRELRVGTARPAEGETARAPHKLYGGKSVFEPYNLAEYLCDAKTAADQTLTAGRLPVFCGGTGLYLRSLIEGISLQPEDSEKRDELRRELQTIAAERGGAALRQRLAERDAAAAERLHEQDIHRLIRALEITELTGQTTDEYHAATRQPPPYRACLIVLSFRERKTLYNRIERRADDMLDKGLIQEARFLMDNSANIPTAAQAIGYKELYSFLRGETGREEAVQTLKQATRRYAKRQLTWFRTMQQAYWLYADDYDSPAAMNAAALDLWEKHRKETA